MTTTVSARGTRYPAPLMTEARKLVDAGWSAASIRRLFERRGISPVPNWTTIRCWTDPDYAERHAAHRSADNRLRSATKSGRLGRPDHTPEFRMARLRALRAAGLSSKAISDLMRFDFGDDISRGQVEYALEVGRYPDRPPRRRAVSDVEYERKAAA